MKKEIIDYPHNFMESGLDDEKNFLDIYYKVNGKTETYSITKEDVKKIRDVKKVVHSIYIEFVDKLLVIENLDNWLGQKLMQVFERRLKEKGVEIL